MKPFTNPTMKAKKTPSNSNNNKVFDYRSLIHKESFPEGGKVIKEYFNLQRHLRGFTCVFQTHKHFGIIEKI